MKKLVHKVGFRAWGGVEVASPEYLPRVIKCFEAVDPEQGFKDMSSLIWTILTRRSRERKALQEFVGILKEIYQKRKQEKREESDMLEALHAMYADIKPDEKRFEQVAVDVLILHVASQANLYAAISWTFINLFRRVDPTQKESKLYLDSVLEEASWKMSSEKGPSLLEKCFYESIRISQQSLTLRLVLQPVEFPRPDGEGEKSQYKVVPGYYIATLLSCLNCEEDKIQEGEAFRPEENVRENGKLNLIKKDAECSVSTFGHGVHACPGRIFAEGAMKMIIDKFVRAMEFQPRFQTPVKIHETQMGAVGRAVEPVYVKYTKREGSL